MHRHTQAAAVATDAAAAAYNRRLHKKKGKKKTHALPFCKRHHPCWHPVGYETSPFSFATARPITSSNRPTPAYIFSLSFCVYIYIYIHTRCYISSRRILSGYRPAAHSTRNEGQECRTEPSSSVDAKFSTRCGRSLAVFCFARKQHASVSSVGRETFFLFFFLTHACNRKVAT